MLKELSSLIKYHTLPAVLRSSFNAAAAIYMEDRNFFHSHSGLPKDLRLNFNAARHELIESAMAGKKQNESSFIEAVESEVQAIVTQGRRWAKPSDVKKAVERYYGYE